MTITRSTQNQLSKGDFDSIEGDWLAKIEKDPSDLEYYVGVARALVGTGEEARARSLLELLDDHLREAGHWALRLQLLKRAGTLFVPADKLHPTLSSTLGKLYGDRSTYKALFEAVGLHRAPTDIPKTWEKVDRLEGLLAFDVGTVVAMEGKGVGRVVEANLGLESFKVDFERIRGLTVGFKAAPKLLRPLAPDHVLRRKLESPGRAQGADARRSCCAPSSRATTGRSPPARSATSSPAWSRSRSGPPGGPPPASTGRWWRAAAARARPTTGPRAAATRSTRSGRLSSAPTRARRSSGCGARGRATRGCATRWPPTSPLVGEEVADSDPGLAFEIWFAIERSGSKLVDEVDWTPDDLLTGQHQRLFSGIEERLLRERAYAMVRERREDWPVIYRDAMSKESDPRALDLLADGLATGAPRELDRLLDSLLAQPHRNPPAFVWLAERAAVDEAMRTRNALRMLQQILTTLSRDEFATYRVRLLALAESGGTVPRLLSHLTEDQAAQAEDAIQRAAPLEPYQRETLVNAIHLRFQGLRKDSGPPPIYALIASVEAKRAELQQIISIDIPANRKAIEEARAMGDLRENFEYKSARQRHEYLNARAATLNADLQRVRLIEPGGMDISEVRIGTQAHLTGAEASG